MGGRFRGPVQIDYLDIDNPKQNPQLPPRREWKTAAVICITGLFSMLLFIVVVQQLHAYLLMISLTSSNIPGRLASGVLLWLIYCVPVAIMLLGLYHGHFYLRNLTKQQGLVNILEKQVSVDDVSLLRMLLAPGYFDVAKTRAQQSQFHGIQTLTYDASRTGTTMPPEQPVLPSEEQLIQMLPEGSQPLLLELKERGYINRSNDSIFIGFKKE